MQTVLKQFDGVVEMLLQSGADVNITDIFGQSTIFRARTEESFRLLLQYGADINIRDKFGRTPVANFLLYIPPYLPKMGLLIRPDLVASPPLATLFFEEGLDVNATDKQGFVLLHCAAWHSDLNMIVLLKHGARKDIIDARGFTPYDLAVAR